MLNSRLLPMLLAVLLPMLAAGSAAGEDNPTPAVMLRVYSDYV